MATDVTSKGLDKLATDRNEALDPLKMFPEGPNIDNCCSVGPVRRTA